MYECDIVKLGIKTKAEYYTKPYDFVKKNYNIVYADFDGCTGFYNNNFYIDYIPNFQKGGNITFTIDNAYNKINEYFYYNKNKHNRNYVLNYGLFGENITMTALNYLDIIIGDKIKYNNVIFEVIDYIKPDDRLNVIPFGYKWWERINHESNENYDLVDLINFPGVCGYYAKIIQPGFLSL